MSETSGSEGPIIRIRDLAFSRGERVILDGVDMDVPRGAIVAIMGPSGVGKTTILKLISGQLPADRGSIEVDGQLVSSMSRGELMKFRRELGFLLQNGALFTDLTVFENIATPLREHTRLDENAITDKVNQTLETVGLAGTEDLMPQELSGGMARRVALARAVVLQPTIILYDEPTTGLDPIGVSTILELIRRATRDLGLTSIVVTHDVEMMTRLADYCYVIAGARIAAEGRPSELLESNDPAVHQFMNGEVEGPIPFKYEDARGGPIAEPVIRS